MWENMGIPSDLVAFADLVHAPRESTQSSKKDGDGAGTFAWDPPGVANGSKAAGRGAVLKDRHVLHAGHSRFVPYQSLCHLSFSSFFFFFFFFWWTEQNSQFGNLFTNWLILPKKMIGEPTPLQTLGGVWFT